MKTLNDRVRQLRKQTGLSQSQFADKFEIPKNTLQDWEQKRRTPPPYVVSMMAKILDIEKETLHCKN